MNKKSQENVYLRNKHIKHLVMGNNDGIGSLVFGVATAFIGGVLSLWVYQKLFQEEEEELKLHEYKENEKSNDGVSVVDEENMENLENGLEKAVEEIESENNGQNDSDWEYEEYDFSGEQNGDVSEGEETEKKQAVKRAKQTETLNSDGKRRKVPTFGSFMY